MVSLDELAKAFNVKDVDAEFVQHVMRLSPDVICGVLIPHNIVVPPASVEALGAPLHTLVYHTHEKMNARVLNAWHAHQLGKTLRTLHLYNHGMWRLAIDARYDEALDKLLASAAPTLETLVLAHQQLSDNALFPNQFMPALKHLELRSLPNVNGTCFKHIAQACPELHTLVLKGKQLVNAHLWHLRYHPSLSTLKLTTRGTLHSAQILPEVFGTLTSLRKLVLKSRAQLLKQFWHALVEAGVWHNLERFELEAERGYVGDTIGHAPHLTHFRLAWTSGVLGGTEGDFDLRGAPALRHVELDFPGAPVSSRFQSGFRILTAENAMLDSLALRMPGDRWSGIDPHLDLSHVRCNTLHLTTNLALIEHIAFPQRCRTMHITIVAYSSDRIARDIYPIINLNVADTEGLRELYLYGSGLHPALKWKLRKPDTLTVFDKTGYFV